MLSIRRAGTLSSLALRRRASAQFVPRRAFRPMALAPSEEAHVDSLEQIGEVWQERLRRLNVPAAAKLVRALSPENPLGYVNTAGRNNAGTLTRWVEDQKRRHPDKVLLVRVGDFYEAYGVDALLLVEHCGLNPMAQKARAGCPIPNVQQTLNGLTSAGFAVNVYEEHPHELMGGTKLKKRFLSQVVTPASPTYLHEACMGRVDLEYAEPPPVAGVCGTASGYTLVLLHLDSRVWRVHRHLSEAALRSHLAAREVAPPLYAHDVPASLRFLPTERRAVRAGAAGFAETVLADACDQMQLSPRDFRLVAGHGGGADAAPQPLYLSSATQLGVLPQPGIPDLPRALVAPTAPAACVALLRRWLLVPPRPAVADAARAACAELATVGAALPACRPLPVGKLTSMISARQGNVPLFGSLRLTLRALLDMLDAPTLQPLNTALLGVVREEAGITIPQDDLAAAARATLGRIDALLPAPPDEDFEMLSPSPPGAAADAAAAAAIAETVDRPTKLADVPDAFFARNEAPFRGMIHPERAAAEYADVDAAAEALAAAARDGAAGEYELVHDLINNALYFKDAKKKVVTPRGKKKTEAAAEATEATKVEAAASEAVAMAAFEAAVDRNRKSLPNRFITARVRDATARYLEACADATAAGRRELQGLCEEVEAELPALTTAAHWSLVSSALAAHVECGVGKGWALPTLLPSDADARALRLDGAWPYWLSRDAAVANDVDWEGLWLLTAPNMAGKSSLMRTMAVSALLANAGLMAPVESAAVPRYDKYFVRVAAFDAPAEGKSSFAQEVDDLHVMTTECTPRSLVMLDEIGRGTSTVEGAALSAALLEWLDTRRIGCLFATHLHEIFPLLDRRAAGPLASLRRVCLGVEPRTDGGVSFLYTLQDGACTFSHAMHAARAAGLPADLIARAESLIAGADDEGEEAAASPQPARTAAAAAAALEVEEEAAATVEGGVGQWSAVEGVLRELTADLGGDVTRVPPRCRPPPKLAGRSCLYVLNLPPKTHAEARPLYVGESDAIGRRLGEHRKKHGADRVDCWLVEVPSKTEATRLEAEAIRLLKTRGLGRVLNVAHGQVGI